MRKKFAKLLTDGRYHFFIYYSPLPLPFSLAVHTWLVTISPDASEKIKRYEVRITKNKKNKEHGYLHINSHPPEEGQELVIGTGGYFFDGRIIFRISGRRRRSLAAKIVRFVEKNADKYPLKSKYSLIGPNCNTFTKWIMNHFPRLKFIKLPWNAVGKDYKI